jgi:high-affinity Fe2+/Pb2+ permease
MWHDDHQAGFFFLRISLIAYALAAGLVVIGVWAVVSALKRPRSDD